jgi:hypothetical protein
LGMGMERKTPARVVYESLLPKSSCVRSMLQPNNNCKKVSFLLQ